MATNENKSILDILIDNIYVDTVSFYHLCDSCRSICRIYDTNIMNACKCGIIRRPEEIKSLIRVWHKIPIWYKWLGIRYDRIKLDYLIF